MFQVPVQSAIYHSICKCFLFQQHLDVTAAENRHAINRAHRWFDQTEKAWGYSRVSIHES